MVKLDSRFEGPNGKLDWQNVNDKFNRFAAEESETVDALFFGRQSYQLIERFRPAN